MKLKALLYLNMGMFYDRTRRFLRSLWGQYRNVPYISYGELVNKKNSDTVFIIGSGTTINGYSEEMREEIAKNDSITFNNSILYGIHSTYHMIVTRADDMIVCHNLNIFHAKSPDTILLLKTSPAGKNTLEHISFPLRKHCFLVKAQTMPVKRVCDLESVLRFVSGKSKRYCRNREIAYLLYQKRASAFELALMARDLGYKKIVLCGVELNNDNYFFEEMAQEYEKEGYIVPPLMHTEGEKHMTNDPALGEVTVSELIYALNDNILKKEEIDLYVATENSVLADRLPVYWGKEWRGTHVS